tara:strand:- start:52008 stop:52193 length:186 start_codon:yes stop_codon:yes gene_type:complete
LQTNFRLKKQNRIPSAIKEIGLARSNPSHRTFPIDVHETLWWLKKNNRLNFFIQAASIFQQ